MPASVTTIAPFPTSTGNGTEPDGQLFIDSNGDLLGATTSGGANGIGTTYEIVKTGGGFASTPTFLADIPIGLNTLVGVPNLSADASGDLFGLMFSGGANTLGTVVEFPAGGGPSTVLANFTGGANGANPGGKVLVDASGDLFGTTASGGAHGAGTVFEIKNNGGVYLGTPITLTSFSSGITPSGSGNLVEDAAGNLFGTTTSSVFEVVKTVSGYSSPVTLVSFPVGTEIGNLNIDSKGDIFGTTISGGANDDGTVFEIKKTGGVYASAPTTLVSFSLADGKLTLGRTKSLTLDANGDVFGTTDPSSQNNGGVVYEIVNHSGVYDPNLTVVVNLQGTNTRGLGSNVVADAAGNLYTTTQTGPGVSGTGAVLEITGSGFATTPVTPNINNILWQNASTGQASIWEIDGNTNTLIGGGPVTPNPGTSWRAVGTGDFNKDSKPDILWQNTNTGQASIWEMSGNTLIGGGPVTPNPGPNWHAVGTGDFNKDGFSDILWQNTVTGQASIWEMQGNTLVGGGPVSPNPGTAWKAIGTGDFNKDGFSDLLWQNSNTGQISIWEMQNNTLIGGGPVTPNPGTAWQAIGTGDFNQDGFSDILLQNKNSGAVSVWEMDGASLIGGGPVANPGTSGQAIGTGAGGSDILLQNSSGQATIWEMSGNTIAGGGAISPNPGTSWRAVGLT